MRDKLHLIYNEKAELFNSIIILEDVNDWNLLEYKPIAEFIYGKHIVDNGNVNKTFPNVYLWMAYAETCKPKSVIRKFSFHFA